MAYCCEDTAPFLGKTIGTGHCVDLVKKAAKAPATVAWKEGAVVKGNALLAKGTAIATFQDGKYNNRQNGDSHAALYLRQDNQAIYVVDQWLGQPVHQRPIWFRNGKSTPNNDGDAYAVIE